MVYPVRIVNLDFYMNAPIPGLDVLYSEFRGTSVKQVPILRVFGCTESGEKICVHVHGVFPYLYIPYDGKQEVNSLIYQIASSIDKIVNTSLNQASSTTQHVYKITLVSGIPMYGYHSRSHQFLKISLYNPLLIRKVSGLLMNETMLGKLYQPHETHLSYTLQFMIDYNLHGMSNMVLSQLKFRRDLNRPLSNIDESLLMPSLVRKISVCELEVDAMAEHIVNREEVISGNIAANPGIAALWADEMQRRRNKGETSQIDHPLELSRTNVEPTKSHYLFKQALNERLSVLSTEKQTEDNLNLSVYPAETPDMASIPNASQCDSGTPSSLELSLDETLNNTIQTDDEPTLNEDALKLLEILNNLNDSNPELNHEDSILSQVAKKEEDDENELDLTMPLESISTPQKVIPTHDDDSNDSSDDLNKTIIPQLDGEADNDNMFNCSKQTSTVKTKQDTGLWNQLQKEKITAKVTESRKRVLSPSSLNRKESESKFFSLDGTWDSNSSSDEETNKKNRKLRSRSDSVDKYTPLPISIHSPRGSPKVRSEVVKKQLNFSEERFQHSNFIEEKVLGKLSPSIRNSEKSVVSENSLATQTLNNINKEKYGNVGSNCDDSSKSSENLFDDDENDALMNKSFFGHLKNIESKLTVAQRYDIAMNYVAKEGTSKVLTPTSQKTPNTPSDETSSIPPYQKFQEDNIVFSNSGSLLSSGIDGTDPTTLKVLKPVKSAPTRLDVINSLSNYNIPVVKSTEPFYSNVEDVAGGMEVGLSLLKIPSKTTQDLTDFESLTDGLNTHRKSILDSLHPNMQWKKSTLDNIALSYCEDRECVLIPLRKPPTRRTVVKWLEGKLSKREDTAEVHKTTEKTKIYIPMSPGGKDEDLELSLTLTPCTPSNSQGKSSDTSTLRSSSASPSLLKMHKEVKQSSQDVSSDNTTLRSSSTSPVLVKKAKQSINELLKSSINQSSIYKPSQITGVTPNNTFGFNHSLENFKKGRAVVEHQYLTVMVMEVHVTTRGDFKPDPSCDPIRAIFYSILNDVPVTETKPNRYKGIIAINSLPDGNSVPILNGSGVDCDVIYVNSEEELLNKIVDPITHWDPDIVAGYETEMLSWGYLIQRAFTLGLNLKSLLGRTTINLRSNDDVSSNEVKIPGRIVLDVWRLMRHEIALQSYTFESIIYHILHQRVPYYAFKDLTFWWDHRSNLYRHRVARYYLFRVETVLDLFDKLDFLGRTSELARLFGILFFEVLSRGSQFRVESMMLRLAKPFNFIPVSPSVQQRAHMKAPEYIALVLEPESKLYNDPVIVLDFQSLYPSIIIAYNYCFTTCIGRVEHLGKNSPFEFGATQLKVSKRKVEKLLRKDLLNFSPCGVAFVKKKVRDGILPRMLREILDTRLMVKNAMKENKDERVLQKVLHNRQLGLKLIANVTYGYTSANFSGRMPSVEVADSVVSKGRETLQRAIEMVDNTPEWGARVVYGDTDSLFVLVPGRSKEHAFEIGKKISEAVTLSNPDPMKLKLEKVYQPCILQTKKRYVGYMYESPDQKEPVYEAKGIETVRRDGCPAVSKMLEKCLKILFDTKDISLVKKYVLRQFNKIHAGRASIQDLTFAREYRGASGYRPSACVPALELTRRWMAVDIRNEPRSGERVPYIIVNGPPGLPLIRLVRSPRDLLNDPSLRPNAVYYITRVIIPPINRCFNLIGVDLHLWYNQMARKQIQTLPNSVSPGKKSTISQYFSTTNCLTCNEQTQTGICGKCRSKSEITTVIVMEKLRSWETADQEMKLICQSCTSCYEVKCASLDCPVLYRRVQASRDAQQTLYVRQLLDELF